jgi:hypothetical protein
MLEKSGIKADGRLRSGCMEWAGKSRFDPSCAVTMIDGFQRVNFLKWRCRNAIGSTLPPSRSILLEELSRMTDLYTT